MPQASRSSRKRREGVTDGPPCDEHGGNCEDMMDKTRSELRRYDIRAIADGNGVRVGKWLGTFVVTHDGLLFVRSDYGSYSYWWGSTGTDDFREFLLELDDAYLLGKISPGDEYDPEETEKSIKQAIIRLRRDMTLNAKDARTEWEHMDRSDFSSEVGFSDWGRGTKLSDWYEYANRQTSPRATLFASRVWPLFCAALRAEMAAEQTDRTSAQSS
jgi:hypothetical protein